MGAEPNIVRSIWKHRVLVIVIAALFAFVGAVVWATRPVSYAASAGALLEDPRSQLTSQSPSLRDVTGYVANQIAIMKSSALLARASVHMRATKGITPLTAGELQQAMSVQADQGSSYVTVHVDADDPATAKVAADSIIYAYRQTTRANVVSETQAALRRLDDTIAAVAHTMSRPNRTAAQQATALALIQSLRGRRNRIEVEGQVAGDGVSLFSPAAASKRRGVPVFTSVLIGFVVGGLIGCGAAYLIEAVGGRRVGQQPPGRGLVAAPVKDNPETAPVEGGVGPMADSGTEPVARRGRRWA